jgi:hypothetical protein
MSVTTYALGHSPAEIPQGRLRYDPRNAELARVRRQDVDVYHCQVRVVQGQGK